MADEDLKAELERLKTENERLKGQRGRSVSLKVSEKVGPDALGSGPLNETALGLKIPLLVS